MKKFTKAVAVFMLTVAAMIAAGCTKTDEPDGDDDNPEATIRVTTLEPQDISFKSVVCSAKAMVSEGVTLRALGLCWSTEANPTYDNLHSSTPNWQETYVKTIDGLEPGTTYHVRAYAWDGSVYYYGQDKSFTTLQGTNHTGDIDGYGYVDLGLPSGNLWAICNVGAENPEEIGSYFAWAETEPKDQYEWENYKYCYGGSWKQLTKYCNKAEYGYNGYVDNLTNLEPIDDAATVNWGGGWRTPTWLEWQELYDYMQKTEDVEVNGVKVRVFTSKNENTFALPLAGWKHGEVYSAGISARYWTSTYAAENMSYCFKFVVDGPCSISGATRDVGYVVRAVHPAQ